MRNEIRHFLIAWVAVPLVPVMASTPPSSVDPGTAALVQPTTPDLVDLPPGKVGMMIKYGFDLLANTSEYIGPRGKVGRYTRNRMACRNCHMDVGMRAFGNSWLDTQALYPQYRTREGEIQTLSDRINACMEHNLLGKPLPVDSHEMKSMLLYYKWLGRNRPALEKDPDQRMPPIQFLTRAADPAAGAKLFESKCASCHGAGGEGRLRADNRGFIYPPLWGPESFSNGASLSRLTLLSRFIKGNMPYGATADKPQLSDEEAWDISAFVLSHKRPGWTGKKRSFPDLAEKPFDFPIGPYADSFPAKQHLLGPFQPIIDHWKAVQGERAKETTTGI